MIKLKKLQKYRLCHQAKLIIMNILQVTIFYLSKAFHKQTRTSEYQGQKQIKPIQNNKTQLVSINANNYTKE